MRCAIYFIPPQDHPLAVAAAAWLRRDTYTGVAIPSRIDGMSEAEHSFLTAAPRRYGFHATIKAPFRLAEGVSLERVHQRLESFVAQISPFDLQLEIASIGSFFALVPKRKSLLLDELAARVVAEFDSFRAPLSDEEMLRRNTSHLSGRQLLHLRSWGYPYVFDQFRFHMTLTGPVAHAERGRVQAALDAHFGATSLLVDVSQLAIAVEPEDLAPFFVYSVHPFARLAARLTA